MRRNFLRGPGSRETRLLDGALPLAPQRSREGPHAGGRRSGGFPRRRGAPDLARAVLDGAERSIFGPTRPERNGPWGLYDAAISRVDECSCVYERRCRKTERCIDDIGVAEVMSAIHRRLDVSG